VVGSGALGDIPPLFSNINEEFDGGIGAYSVVIVGVVGVTADGEGVVPLVAVVGLIIE
jgi:hypothetical protein